MSQRGSALLVVMFVMVLLTGMGIALLSLGQRQVRIGTADLGSKQAYFQAEAGVEAGRQALFNTNGDGPFSDDLVAAAGTDGVLDFDPATVAPVYDAGGNLTGFTGYDDDVELLAMTALGDGWYAAFLTNDPAETGGIAATADTNDRVMITGVGADGRGSFEVVQAIVEPAPPFPGQVPATITKFGPSPSWDDANSASKTFDGDDCNGSGIPGFSAPVVGLLSTSAEGNVESALENNTVYTSAGNTDDWTVVDLTDPTDPGVVGTSIGLIDSRWNDCARLVEMTEEVRAAADVVCLEGFPCSMPPSAPDRVVFAEGDLTLSGSTAEAGMLWVTGTLTMDGALSWDGLIVVVGEGRFLRNNGGTSTMSGAMIMADIAGGDNQYGTSDDCTGGTNGFRSTDFDEAPGVLGLTTYCNADVLAATPITKYAVVDFLQR